MENREKHLTQCKAYNDRAGVKQHALEYQKKRRAEDGVFRLKCRMRARIGQALKNAGESSTAKVDCTVNMFGCTPTELIEHLEKYGDNISACDVDHIFPIDAYDVVNDQLKYMHFTNMQLLTEHENRKKSKTLPTKEMAAKVDRNCWPDGITMDMLPDIYPGWATPLRMHAA